MSARIVRRMLPHPLVVATIVTLALAFVVWFLGPLAGYGDWRPLSGSSPRIGGFLILALAWGLFAALLSIRRQPGVGPVDAARRREEAEGAAMDAREREDTNRRTAAMRHRLLATVARLGRERWRGRFARRAFLLPWYLVIGAPGSGKTSMLSASNLNTLFDPPPVGGGGEDDIDILVTENALFIDVSGRLASETAKSAPDREVWWRLLRLLARLRPAQPAAGILLAVDAPSLAVRDDEARLNLARTLRRLLDETSEQFRTRPPVYLVFTKLDRLPGFTVFFDTTDRGEREGVWGFPLLSAEEERELAPLDRFASGFGELLREAAKWRLSRLQEEGDEGRRTLLYELPDQFALLGRQIGPFVRHLGTPHRFGRAPFLRGVFFTSALQDGPAFDLLGRTVGLDLAGGETGPTRNSDTRAARSRSFFLHDLLAHLAPREAGRSGVSRSAHQLAAARRSIAAVAFAVLLLILAVREIQEFRGARVRASALDAQAALLLDRLPAITPAARLPPLREVLPILEEAGKLERMAATTPAAVGGPAEEARLTYGTSLDRLFIPYLLEGLKAMLAEETTDAADLFRGLELYLALGGARPLSSLDMPALASWMARRWLSGSDDAQRAAFVSHVLALDTHPAARRTTDPALVASARERVAGYTLAQLAFDLANRRADVLALAPWRASDHMGTLGQAAIARASGASLWNDLPGFFTRTAFRDTALPAIGSSAAEVVRGAWVLGSASLDADPDRIRQGAQALYAAEYVRLWDGLLADLTVRPLPSAADGARTLSLLVTQPSPIAELVAAIAAETDLSPPPTQDAITAAAAKAGSAIGMDTPAADPGRAVTDAFAPLRRALAAPEGARSQLGDVLTAFEPLSRQLNHVAQGGNILELGAEPEVAAAQIDVLVASLPPSLQPFFRRTAAMAMELVRGASGERLKQVWKTTVLPACLAATKDRFPFVAERAQETSLEDFKAVFGPEGQIAAFRETYLKPLIDTGVRPWAWRAGRALPLGLDGASLAAFEQADTIAQAFFPGGEGPAARFTLEPVRLDARVRTARFDIGGQVLRYEHGPPIPVGAQWPPDEQGAPAVLTMTPEVEGERNMLTGQGAWALFRLMDQATSRRLVNGNAILATFSLAGRDLTLKLTPRSARNPFELMLLDRFRCPRL